MSLELLFYDIKIVFHNGKELGGFLLHYLPIVGFWKFRYLNADPMSSLLTSEKWGSYIENISYEEFNEIFITTVKMYLMYVLFYYFMVFVILRKRIKEKNRETSYILWFKETSWLYNVRII